MAAASSSAPAARPRPAPVPGGKETAPEAISSAGADIPPSEESVEKSVKVNASSSVPKQTRRETNSSAVFTLTVGVSSAGTVAGGTTSTAIASATGAGGIFAAGGTVGGTVTVQKRDRFPGGRLLPPDNSELDRGGKKRELELERKRFEEQNRAEKERMNLALDELDKRRREKAEGRASIRNANEQEQRNEENLKRLLLEEDEEGRSSSQKEDSGGEADDHRAPQENEKIFGVPGPKRRAGVPGTSSSAGAASSSAAPKPGPKRRAGVPGTSSSAASSSAAPNANDADDADGGAANDGLRIRYNPRPQRAAAQKRTTYVEIPSSSSSESDPAKIEEPKKPVAAKKQAKQESAGRKKDTGIEHPKTSGEKSAPKKKSAKRARSQSKKLFESDNDADVDEEDPRPKKARAAPKKKQKDGVDANAAPSPRSKMKSKPAPKGKSRPKVRLGNQVLV